MQRVAGIVVGMLVVSAACSDGDDRPGSRSASAPASARAPGSSSSSVPAAPVTVVAVGDIATCESSDDEAVAALVAARSGPVLLLGDLVYPTGSARNMARCFDPAWGPLRERLRPALGNHDYYESGAQAYFDYFGAAAGERGQGWYSFDVGGWHVVALNSNCAAVSGCQAGSEQERWLRAELAAAAAGAAVTCTLAYWHHARFSSGGVHGSDPTTRDLWRALADAGADVVLTGHEHNYERFAPLDPNGAVDREGGMRPFVVGTGGRSHYGFEVPHPGSEARDSTTFGVLELTLHPDRYEWRFVPAPDGGFTDAGEDRCH